MALCTMASYIQAPHLRRKLKSVRKSAPVILGGGCSATPGYFGELVDVVCVGEGRNFIRTLAADGYRAAARLPESWVAGESRAVIPSDEFPWDMPPVKDTEGCVRLMVSRGCHRSCLFCNEGWWKQYQKNPDTNKVLRISNNLRIKNINHLLVTNDAAHDAPESLMNAGSASVSVSAIKYLIDDVVRNSKLRYVRMGVEGISDRLRSAIGKPIQTDLLASLTARMMDAGKQVTWYFVVGLPGENDDDWNELRSLSESLRRVGSGSTICIFHAYEPLPSTPLCIFPLNDEYWDHWQDFYKWRTVGPGMHRRMRLVGPSMPKTRLARAGISMAASAGDLYRGWWSHDNPNWRVRYTHTPDQLRSIARKYAAKMGMNLNYV